jgi:hypothetical protein
VPSFPDPTRSPPPPGSGYVIGSGGLYLALGPGGSPQSPAFKRAAAACGFMTALTSTPPADVRHQSGVDTSRVPEVTRT